MLAVAPLGMGKEVPWASAPITAEPSGLHCLPTATVTPQQLCTGHGGSSVGDPRAHRGYQKLPGTLPGPPGSGIVTCSASPPPEGEAQAAPNWLQPCCSSFSSAEKQLRDSRRSCSSDLGILQGQAGGRRQLGRVMSASSATPSGARGSASRAMDGSWPQQLALLQDINQRLLNCCKEDELSKHPFSQGHAGQDSLKHKKEMELVLQPASPGPAASRHRGRKQRCWLGAEQQAGQAAPWEEQAAGR